MSQLVEKIDLMTEMALLDQLISKQPNNQTLITIINLATSGLLAESDQEHKEIYDKEEDQEIPVSPDSSLLFKDMSEICWISKK